MFSVQLLTEIRDVWNDEHVTQDTFRNGKFGSFFGLKNVNGIIYDNQFLIIKFEGLDLLQSPLVCMKRDQIFC